MHQFLVFKSDGKFWTLANCYSSNYGKHRAFIKSITKQLTVNFRTIEQLRLEGASRNSPGQTFLGEGTLKWDYSSPCPVTSWKPLVAGTPPYSWGGHTSECSYLKSLFHMSGWNLSLKRQFAVAIAQR